MAYRDGIDDNVVRGRSDRIRGTGDAFTRGLFIGNRCKTPHIVPVQIRRTDITCDLRVEEYYLEEWVAMDIRDNLWTCARDNVYCKRPREPDVAGYTNFQIVIEAQDRRSMRSRNRYIESLLPPNGLHWHGNVLIMLMDAHGDTVNFPVEDAKIELAKRLILELIYEFHTNTT